MLKITCFCLLFFCLSIGCGTAQELVKRDSVLNILKLDDEDQREKKLIIYIKFVFENCPANRLQAAKAEMDKQLADYDPEKKESIKYFIESICEMRLQHAAATEKAVMKAIDLAVKNDDHYLLYAGFSYLAFCQNYEGYTAEALSSFRRAKKEAMILDDAYFQVLIDINISDIYYHNNFYSQSLFYLDQAYSLVIKHKIKEQRLKNIIYSNKAENYFRMNKPDSLEKYNRILTAVESGSYRLYIFRKRTGYYVSLLHHDYENAIKSIIALKTDPLYRYDDEDQQNLADAYFHEGKTDSAKHIIKTLLAAQAQTNHPEIKLHLYEVLGEIAEKEHADKEASGNFKMALRQAKDQIGRLTEVDTISSQIKMDEMQGTYTHKEKVFKKERLWMLLAIIVALLTIAVGAMLYRNIKQKRYYEMLLFTAKKEELAFINSHEVRRHLSNILGIVDLIKHSDNSHEEYVHAEENLLKAAENLDRAIKNISEKLDNS